MLPEPSDPDYAKLRKDETRKYAYVRGQSRDVFVGRLAYYLGEVNVLHPFREGNGRAQRVFFAQLARSTGSRSPGSILMPPATSRPPPR